jgi:hypothetical protein
MSASSKALHAVLTHLIENTFYLGLPLYIIWVVVVVVVIVDKRHICARHDAQSAQRKSAKKVSV